MRHRRRDMSPDKVDSAECIAHYKQYPDQFLPVSSPQPLYTSSCDKCCSQGNSYIVDRTSRILGEVDSNSMRWGSESVSRCLVRFCVASVYSEGVLVSPGQLEVLRSALRSGAVVLMSLTDGEHQGPVSDVVLQTLALLSYDVTPSVICIKDTETWSSWALSVLGLQATMEDQTDLTNVISKGGLVIAENITDILQTLVDKCHDRNLLVVPASASHDLCHGSRRGHRARLDVGLPMSVREMIGGQDGSVTKVVTHCDIIGRRQIRVTPSQLVSFVVQTRFQNLKREELTVEDLSRAVGEIISLLEARGARMSFSGENRNVVEWAVKRMGGCITSDKVNLELDEVSILRAERLESYFLFDFAVSVGVMSSLKESVVTTRTGARSSEQSVTVGHQEVVDTAVTVLQFLAEDRASLLPCEDLTQGVMEAMFRAETSGSLVTLTEERGSQYEPGVSERQRHNIYGWRHNDDGWNEDEEGERADTRMVVGHSQAGRDWLDWTAGIMRHRLRNLYITLLVLYNNAATEIFTQTELEAMVREEYEKRSKKGWKQSCLLTVSNATRKSIVALEILGFVKIIHKEDLSLIQVSDHHEIAEMIQVVLEFRC